MMKNIRVYFAYSVQGFSAWAFHLGGMEGTKVSRLPPERQIYIFDEPVILFDQALLGRFLAAYVSGAANPSRRTVSLVTTSLR